MFVSCSLWEGFNLPLVEAQALGTVGIAFDSGAHPEVTPLVFSDTRQMLEFLLRARSSTALSKHSRIAYRHVRSLFSWNRTAGRFQELVLSRTPGQSVTRRGNEAPLLTPSSTSGTDRGFGASLVGTVKSVRNYGWRITARRIKRRLGQLRGRLAGHRQ